MKRGGRTILRAALIFFLTVSPVFANGEQEIEQPDEFVLGFMTSLTGPFATVAETQRMGTMLAVEQINAAGGLSMPWGRVPIRLVERDDEARLDVGVQRFRELVDEGINGLVGTVWNPMAAAINEEIKITPVPFIAACIPALDSFRAGNPATGFYSAAYSPWTIGYIAGASVINELGAETIYFVSRSDPWGATIYEGVEAALEEHGGEIIGIAEFPQGTVDYSRAVDEALELEPDVFMATQVEGDAIALFRQAHDMGLTEVTTPFGVWVTNVMGRGIPGDALSEVYGLSYFYHDVTGIEDGTLADRAGAYTDAYLDRFGEPPGVYGTLAYIATSILFEAVEEAGTFDIAAVTRALESKEFETVKGAANFRQDHQLVSDYLAFFVRGKDPADSMGQWDVFEVLGHFGGASVLPPLESLGY